MSGFLYNSYVRAVPPPLRKLLLPIISSPDTLRQLVAYGSISVTCFITDILLLKLFLVLQLPLSVAVSCAYLSAVTLQFFLNKYVTFRAFDRVLLAQGRTYFAVTGFNWLLALAFVEVGVRMFHVHPMTAKYASVPVIFVVGFIANRHLTFGAGITATVRRYLLLRP